MQAIPTYSRPRHRIMVVYQCQPPHNCVILTGKKLCEIVWQAVRDTAYDLHQLMHNFTSHAPLQKSAWVTADSAHQLLKPSVNCRLANSSIRKMWNRFLKRLILLNYGFHNRRRWVRHISSPCIRIDYLKTFECYTFKTSQCKKGKNAHS